jgi:hypothetical protein
MIQRVLASLAACACLVSHCAAGTLDSIATRQDFSARRESSYDRSGGNADNRRIGPGATLTIADIDGPGAITHLWFTFIQGRDGMRDLVLRAYFDGAETPCVEAPIGDFFGLGNNQIYPYASEPLAVATYSGLNSYWKMPFSRHARLTVTNQGSVPCGAFYYYVDHQAYDKPQPDTVCFHAVYHQAMPCRKGEPYVLLEAQGAGHYVGCNLSIEQLQDSWWGEGDDRFFIDGETTPSIVGTGSEDYFGGSWCYSTEFAFPYIGMPLRGRFSPDGTFVHSRPGMPEKEAAEWKWPVAWRIGDLWNVYRYHIQDPVPFRKSLRVEIEHGHINNERQDAYSSVAYWYQSEPHGPQPPLPGALERRPFCMRPHEQADGKYELENFAAETTCTRGIAIGTEEGFWRGLYSWVGGLNWEGGKAGDTMTLPLAVEHGGRFKVDLHGIRTRASGIFDVALDGTSVLRAIDMHESSVFPVKRKLALGKQELTTGTHTLVFRCAGKNPKAEDTRLVLDYLQLKRAK